MKKLKQYIDMWLDGKRTRGVDASLTDIHTCMWIYNEVQHGRKPAFFAGNVKKILDKCGIKTTETETGWRIA